MLDMEGQTGDELASIGAMAERPPVVLRVSPESREDNELGNETNNANEVNFYDEALRENAYCLELPQNTVDQQDMQQRFNTNTQNSSHTSRMHQPNECVLQAPKWIADHDAPVCMNCALPFHSFFRRRHHCRNCGGVFCNICSSLCTPLPKYGLYKAVRVCKDCFTSESKNSQ